MEGLLYGAIKKAFKHVQFSGILCRFRATNTFRIAYCTIVTGLMLGSQLRLFDRRSWIDKWVCPSNTGVISRQAVLMVRTV